MLTLTHKLEKISTINKVSVIYNDKIDLRNKTETFINDAKNRC